VNQPSAADAGTITLGGQVTVNRLGFGARWLGRRGEEQAVQLIRRAIDMQVNFVDTADLYGGGASESLIAKALHPYSDDLVIATKGGQIATADGSRLNGRRDYLREACEASLRRLRVETIDLYQLHVPDPDVPIEESLGALVELQAEGKVRQIGVSNVFRGQIQQAAELAGVVSVQNRYSTADRANDPDLTACEEAGLVFMPYCPLDAGELAAAREESDQRVGTDRGPTAAQLALAWLLQRSESMLPIPGTSSLQHLEENVAAASVRLTPEQRTTLGR
jgi:pyridoxine 4-dehydrogenase